LSERFVVSESSDFDREEFAILFGCVHVFFEASDGFFVFFFCVLVVEDAVFFVVEANAAKAVVATCTLKAVFEV